MKAFVYLALFLYLTPFAFATETAEIKFNALPKPVQKTISKLIEKHHIYKIDKISDGNFERFEIMSTKPVNNTDFLDTDVTLAANGRIIALKKEISAFSLPFNATQQLTHQYPDIAIEKIKAVELS
ncbi:MAG: hypothetical protein ACU83N_08865 [Gammaproteobacteria bacterium]